MAYVDEQDRDESENELRVVEAERDLSDRHFIHEMYCRYFDEGFKEPEAGLRALRACDELDKLIEIRNSRRRK